MSQEFDNPQKIDDPVKRKTLELLGKGLVVGGVVLIAPRFLLACARPSTTEFPTLPTATAPALVKPTRTERPKPVEQGWTRFRSITFPYQMDLPPGWTLSRLDTTPGHAIDWGNTPMRSRLTIVAEPIQAWVTLADYKNNAVAVSEANVRSQRIKVDDIDAWEIISTNKGEKIVEGWTYSEKIETVFIEKKGKRGWKISLYRLGNIELEQFRRALSTFKLLQ